MKEHLKFHSRNGKRLVLIVDDELINREILGELLKNDYELLTAGDGAEALRLATERRETLSLMLLDLNMPGMSGLELLRRMKEDEGLRRIPVIVLTADQEAEVESLSLGASDFIPKPYPRAGVIHARIRRAIELSEDRQILSSTERDPLTGLYNREFFYRYAEQFDQHHKDLEMDAVIVDVNHFHMLNERFGAAYGDEVLRRVGEKLRETVQDTGGIVCRREADTFMVYCPHGKDYRAILENASSGLPEEEAGSRVRLRLGVYADVDKELDIERRFDRAKSAADTVKGSFTRTIGFYDSTMHERELYAEQLIEGFRRAIEEKQFKVYYQPKFDVRPEIPVLASAEALVRWQHPSLGLISPGVFIPLFEENGLVQTLDQYVWRTAAAQIRDWKERFGITVPVSVNVSRIDMYDPHLIDTLRSILAENGLDPHEFLLEITESAYTEESEQIVEIVGRLRELGFRIEMDDFGTGYSSLNMISTLPIDALKLDMSFIRNAFNQRRDTRMLEVILDIAEYLSVPVIAEGVETEEQLNALKTMGCDMVQGYYFSRPVPAEEYERFVKERRDRGEAPIPAKPRRSSRESSFGKITYALSSGFERVYYIDTVSNHYVEFSIQGAYEDLQIRHSGADFFADMEREIPRVIHEQDRERVLLNLRKEALLSQLLGSRPFTMTYRLLQKDQPVYYQLKAVRAFTHDEQHIVIGLSNVDEQLRQARDGDERENPLDFNSLSRALSRDMESIYYVDTETEGYLEFVSDGAYGSLKLETTGTCFFEECRKNIQSVVYADDRERVTAALERETLLSVLSRRPAFFMDYRLLIEGKPQYYRMKVIRADKKDGSHIIIGVSNVNDQITEEQRQEAEQIKALRIAQQIANRDALTGVKSRHAFTEAEESWDARIRAGEELSFAVAFCDVDGLKEINDTKGHKAGDQYLKDAAAVICNLFKHSPVYRIGGDEFVAVLGGSDYAERETLVGRLRQGSREGTHPGGVIISCGLADYEPGRDSAFTPVFERADAAMYVNKAELKKMEN